MTNKQLTLGPYLTVLLPTFPGISHANITNGGSALIFLKSNSKNGPKFGYRLNLHSGLSPDKPPKSISPSQYRAILIYLRANFMTEN